MVVLAGDQDTERLYMEATGVTCASISTITSKFCYVISIKTNNLSYSTFLFIVSWLLLAYQTIFGSPCLCNTLVEQARPTSALRPALSHVARLVARSATPNQYPALSFMILHQQLDHHSDGGHN
jgi:hypothetical protein